MQRSVKASALRPALSGGLADAITGSEVERSICPSC
ncbi:hypothetical protein OCEANICA350_10054 [Oceanicaulis sp. 350]|nr:hypothetical protein OCEANICA350_10054 [Oceanicaulis sp. 350]